MTCSHTETTAVLAVFGEAPADFAQHLEACAACREAVAAHTQTVALVGPILRGRVRERQSLPYQSASRGGWSVPALGLALAAGLLLVLQDQGGALHEVAGDTGLASDMSLMVDSIDSEIEGLELELALLVLED